MLLAYNITINVLMKYNSLENYHLYDNTFVKQRQDYYEINWDPWIQNVNHFFVASIFPVVST